MITATKLDAVRGDTNIYTFSYGGEGSLLPASVVFQITTPEGKVFYESTSVGIAFSPGSGYTVTLSPSVTQNLQPVLHVFNYSLRITTVDGLVKTIFQGPLYIFTNITAL